MPRQELVSIATGAQMRSRQITETLTVERDFWMKMAEQLHDQLENIFDQAEEHGKVDLYRNGKTIKLVSNGEH
jgi:hypothetical protein